MTKIFRILNKKTGLFSTGGSSPGFSKRGKIWTSRSALSNHLNLVTDISYNDCELITYELTETEMSREDMISVVAAQAARVDERDRKRKARDEAFEAELKLARYVQLKRELNL